MSKKSENKKNVIIAPNGARLVVSDSSDRQTVEDMIAQVKKTSPKKDSGREIPTEETSKKVKMEEEQKLILPSRGSFFKKWEDSEKGAVYTKIDKEGNFNDLEIVGYDPKKGKVEIREYAEKKREGAEKTVPGKPSHYYLKYDEFIALMNSGYKKDIDRGPKEIELMGETLTINKEYVFSKKEDKQDRIFFRIGTYKPGELSKNPENKSGSIRKAGTFSVFINNKERGFGTMEELKKWLDKIRKDGYEIVDKEKIEDESIVGKDQEIPINARKLRKLDKEGVAEDVGDSKDKDVSLEEDENDLDILQSARTDKDAKRSAELIRMNKIMMEKQKEDKLTLDEQGTKEKKPRYSQGEAMKYFIEEQDKKKEHSGRKNALLDDNLDLDQEAEEAILSQRERRVFDQKDPGSADGGVGEPLINSPEDINQGKKIEFEPGGNISEEEAGKFAVDELYKKMERSFVRFSKAQQDSNKLDRLLAKFPGIKDGKKGQAKREYETAKDQFEADRARFRNAYDKYAAAIVKENKEEINKMPLAQGGLDFMKAAAVFLVSGRVVEITKKEIDENGNEKELREKVSLIEDYNNRLRKLNEAKMKSTEGKTKETLKAMWSFYKKRPRWQKIALGAVLSGSLAMTTGGALVGLTYGGYRALKGVGSASLTSGLGVLFTKNLDKFELKKKNELRTKITEKFEENIQDIFIEVDEYNKKLKKKQRNDALKIMGVALAVGGASSIFNDEILEALSGSLPDGQISEITDKVGKSQISDDHLMRTVHDSKEAETFSESESGMKASIRQEEVLDKKIETEEAPKEKTITEVGNSGRVFELGKNGTVWNTLEKSEHFDGDQNKIANALAIFKGEVKDKLMEEHGMEADQASRFIKWRFEHMQPTDTVLISEDGQVEIAGFDDDEMVSRYDRLDRNSGYSDAEKMVSNESILEGNDNFVYDDGSSQGSSSQPPLDELEEETIKETDIEMANNTLDLKEDIVRAKLEAIGMRTDSSEWQTVRNIKVKDLITAVPPKESWFNGDIEGMVKKLKKLSGHDYKLGGFMSNMSFQEFDKLKQLSGLLEKNALSSADKDLSVGEFLGNNIKNIKKIG